MTAHPTPRSSASGDMARFSRVCVVVCLLVAGVASLPASLLEDVQQAELRASNKVPELDAPSTARPIASVGGGRRAGGGRMSDASSSVYRVPGPGGKTVAQYEKGYLYGAGKAALDKHVENALLKSELYGDPTAVNQYRYYGGSSDGRQDTRAFSPPSKRSGGSGFRPMVPRALPVSHPQAAPRLKRDLEVDPEEVLALLALWQNNNAQYRAQNRWPSYGVEPEEFELPEEQDTEELDSEDQSGGAGEWLEGPVYPSGRTHYNIDRRSYYYPAATQYSYPAALSPYQYQYQYPMQKRESAWGGFAKDKRFMVSRKRQAPSLQSQGGIHYLAQLLGPAHHDPRVPLYHRVVL